MLDNIAFSESAIAPVPDRGIVKQLKEYDRDLAVHWDYRNRRWYITGKNQRIWGKREYIMTVMNPDGTYRPLDHRVLAQIMLADALRYNDPRHFEKLLSERHHALDRNKVKTLSDDFRARNEELYRAFFGYKSVAPMGGWKEFN